MRIGIDCRSLSIGGGVRTYLLKMLNEIGYLDRKNQYFLYYSNRNQLGTFKFNNFHEIVIPLKYKFETIMWEQFKLRNAVIKNKIDIFHGPKNTIPLLLPKKIKTVVTILDLTPFILKGDMSFTDKLYWIMMIPPSLKKADKIITISDATTEDVKKILSVDKKKLNRIYLGSDYKSKKIFLAKKKYFIVIGALRARKNIMRILIAFKHISIAYPDYKLYIVGKNLNKLEEVNRLILKLKLSGFVKVTGFLNQSKLDSLYKHATAYVYPSLYEGFGLPILEAQKKGCPVITSNISSMPEVAGNGALFVNPYEVDEIKQAMIKLIEDKSLILKLIKRGIKNSSRFSWRKCAQDTIAVYDEVNYEK